MGKPISDYAIIGDTRSCALVGRDGGIDWLCWPRHDSPAVLARLLDDPQGGFATFEPLRASPDGRRYRGDSAVLDTDFQGPDGRATLSDFMPVHPPSTRSETGPDGDAQSRLVRLVECTRGRIAGRFRLRMTPDYGRATAALSEEPDGWRLRGGGVGVRITVRTRSTAMATRCA